MKLAAIEVRSFRSLFVDASDTPFRLELAEGMNALVGPNNCGKSNVLRAVALALDPHWPCERVRDRATGVSTGSPRVTLEFACDAKTSVENTLLRRVEEYERSLLGPGKKTYASEGTLLLTVTFPGGEQGESSRLDSFLIRGVGARPGDPEKRQRAVAQFRKALQFIMLESGQSLESMLTGRFREILHTVIQAHLRDQFDSAERKRLGFIEDLQGDLLAPLQNRIEGVLTQLFPEITDVSLVPSVPSIDETLSNVAINLTDAVPTALAAKGTGVRGAVLVAMLRYLAEYSKRSMVFAVEEPEAFLHPGAQEELRDDLEGLAERPDVTLLVTSHSPFVVSRQPKSKLVALAKDAQGRTRIVGQARGPETHFSLLGGLFRDAALPDILARSAAMPPGTRAVLLVEGRTDADFLGLAAERARRPELVAGLHIIPCGGAEHLVVEAALTKAQTPLPVMALFDNDEIGRAMRESLRKRFSFHKTRELMHYGEVLSGNVDGIEAEDLFPTALIQAFVDDQGEQTVVKTKTYLPDGQCRFDLNLTGKDLIAEFVRQHATEADVERWVHLMELIWSRMGLVPEAILAPASTGVGLPEEPQQAGVGQKRAEFFRRAMERLAESVPKFRIPKASPERNWIYFRSGPFGSYSLNFPTKGLRVEAYLDMQDRALTKLLFDKLWAKREALENAYGEQLGWERLDDRSASRIAAYRTAPNLDDPEKVEAALSWAVTHSLRFLEVFDEKLRTTAASLRA